MTPFLLILLGILPGFYFWYRSLNRVKLARAELQIAKSVTAMETLLLEGAVKAGDCCHDHFFETMKLVQDRRLYPVPWRVFRQEKPEHQALKERLKKELENGDGQVKTILRDFTTGYYRAVRAAHPLEAHIFILSCCFLAGILPLVLAVLELVTRGINEAKQFNKLRQNVKATVVAASCAEVVESPDPPFQLAPA